MDIRRRLKANSIKLEINECKKFIERSTKTIGRLKHSNLGIEFVRKQIDKLKTSISEKEEKLSVLNSQIVIVDKGGLDNEIDMEYSKNKSRKNKLDRDKEKITKENKKEKQEKKEKYKKYWDGIVGAARSERQKMRDMRYAQSYFEKTFDNLPEYMKRNLADMPNNKGYIWKGIYFYGDLPEQSGPRVLFEKRKGGLLIIHEYTDKEYKLFEKNGKERKRLLERYERKKKN